MSERYGELQDHVERLRSLDLTEAEKYLETLLVETREAEYDLGYDSGYEDGRSEEQDGVYEDGRDNGYSDGYQDGRADGHQAGLEEREE